MRKLFLLGFLFLAACSQSESNLSSSQESVEALSQLVKVSGNGSFSEVTGNKIVIFKIQNTGTSLSEIPSPGLLGTNAADFAIVHTNGCSSGLLNSAFCQIRVSFASAGKVPGSYSATLKVGLNLEIPLSATVPAPSGVILQISENSVPVESLNMGTISRTQSVTKYLSVKNNGLVDSTPLVIELTNTNFSLAANTCQGKVLKPQQACGFMVQFSTLGKTPATYLADLLVAEAIIPLSGQVLTVPPAGEEGSGVEIQTFVNNEPLSEADLDLGIFPNNQGIVKVITFKNVGTQTSEPLTATLNSGENFSLVSNGCTNKILPPNASCTVRIVFSALSKLAGHYSVSWNFGGASTSVEAEVLSTNFCPSNYHLVAPVCINNLQACAYEHGTGEMAWNGSAYGSCYAVACESGYDLVDDQCLVACAGNEHRHPTSHVCEANVLDCTPEITHATSATQTWQGESYGSCILQTCANGYVDEENECRVECALSEHRNPLTLLCDPNAIDCTFGDNMIQNGTFDTNVNSWTGSLGQWSATGGGSVQISTLGGPPAVGTNYFRQNLVTMAGKKYFMNFDFLASGNPGSAYMLGYAVNGGDDARNGTKLTSPVAYLYPVNDIDYEFTAVSNSTTIVFATEAVASYTVVDNISVRPLTFDHSTAASILWNPDEQEYAACAATACAASYKVQDGICVNKYIIAEGGTVSYDGDYKIHTFTGSGSLNILSVPVGETLDYLVVAGGGASGGGNDGGGGGGGGGFLEGFSHEVTPGLKNIIVGSGGIPATNNRGGNGGNSEFDGIIALGGGGGGYYGTSCLSGGSGGGGDSSIQTGCAGTLGQGFAGGNGTTNGSTLFAGGGGGGAGGIGTNAFGGGGNGGIGRASSITGVATYYAGGGGGAAYYSGYGFPAGAGGLGGGGNGVQNGIGNSGANGKGGGAGGSGWGATIGASGGSGVVIVRYRYQ